MEDRRIPGRLVHSLRNLGWLAGSCLLFASSAANAQSLEARIQALLGSPLVHNASVGLSIVELTPQGPKELFRHQADTALIPASNTKLLTTAAAFETYGSKATLVTELYRAGPHLLLVGSGDPGLGDDKLCAEVGWSVTAPFDQWAENLRKAGLTEYQDLVVDDSQFDRQFIHPNWPKDQLLAWYEAPVGGLNFNANCLDWKPKLRPGGGVEIELIPETSFVSVTVKAKRGAEQRVWLWRPAGSRNFEMRGTVKASAREAESVTIEDPGLWTGTILKDRLAKVGLRASGEVRRGTIEGPRQLLARFETPLVAVLKRANRNSVNMMAEALCKKLGHDATGQPGSWENGTAAVQGYLQKLGATPEQVQLDDGSGLSPHDRVAASVFTRVLAHVAARPDGQIFVETLAAPGEDGTLERRLTKSPLTGALRAKTGHIKGASTLSGYLDVNSRRFAFSILVNRYQGNVNPWQDQVCTALYHWADGH